MSDLQVIGLVRFSYPSAPGAFGQDDIEKLRERLYDDARMALRFMWFEHVALPAMRVQTDPDFTLVVMVGDQLPAHHRERLEGLVTDLPQARIVALEEGAKHRLACREVMIAARDPSARAVAEFRLDDDDAVSIGFVADLRARFQSLAPLVDGGGRAALDYARGLLLRTHGAEVELRPVMARLWTPGLAVYRRPNDNASLLDINHLELWRHMPVLSLRYPAMFVRGAHEDNASAVSNRWDKVTIKGGDADRAERVLAQRFLIDRAGFQDVWQSLSRSC